MFGCSQFLGLNAPHQLCWKFSVLPQSEQSPCVLCSSSISDPGVKKVVSSRPPLPPKPEIKPEKPE